MHPVKAVRRVNDANDSALMEATIRFRPVGQRRRTTLGVAYALTMGMHTGVQCQELEPRAFSNTPIGLNFLIASYTYSQGDVLFDPSVPLKDANALTHIGALSYVRSLNVFGRSGKIAFALPYAWLSGSALIDGERRQRTIAGLADPRLRLSLNLYGAPALSFDQFESYRQDTIVGLSLLITAPFGQYDAAKLVNIGTNRWSVKPKLGISKALGRFTLEAAVGATVYSENTDFAGGKVREQDPIYSAEAHILFQFKHGLWGSVDATYFTGGRTSADGITNDDAQASWRYGLSLSIPLSRSNSLKLYGSTGLFTRTGTDFDTVGVAWQYRWGKGF
jgi:hypothetical protein